MADKTAPPTHTHTHTPLSSWMVLWSFLRIVSSPCIRSRHSAIVPRWRSTSLWRRAISAAFARLSAMAWSRATCTTCKSSTKWQSFPQVLRLPPPLYLPPTHLPPSHSAPFFPPWWPPADIELQRNLLPFVTQWPWGWLPQTVPPSGWPPGCRENAAELI